MIKGLLIGITAIGLALFGGLLLHGEDYEVPSNFGELPAVADVPLVERTDRFEVPFNSSLPGSGTSKVEMMKNEPKAILKKWNGEVALGVRYADVVASASRVASSNRVEWKGAKEEVHMYPLEAKAGMEDGGFEIEIVLNEKPTKNFFDFELEGWEDLDFFYQPELTQEEIDEGAFRPENVVGSYAVYHKTKKWHRVGHTNYATGKAYHIFRPKVVDNSGNEIWGELSYSNGVLTVTVPQSFLATADYPVRIDPTFGYTTLGASNQIITFSGDGARRGRTYSFSDSGTLDKISAYLKVGEADTYPNISAFINDEDSAGSGSHDEVAGIEISGVSLTATFQLIDFPATSESLSANDYILNIVGDPVTTTNDIQIGLDTNDSVNQYLEINTYETVRDEDPWTETVSSGTNEYSIYATYCNSSGGFCHYASSSVTSGSATSSLSATVPAQGIPSGSLIVVSGTWVDSSEGQSTVTDSVGNTYTSADHGVVGSNDRYEVLYSYNSTALSSGDTITINYNNGDESGNKVFVVDAFTGVGTDAADPFDQVASSTGTGTTADSGNTGTTQQADELIYGMGFYENDAGATYDVGDTFTLASRDGTDGGAAHSNQWIVTGYKVASSTGMYNATTTSTESVDWAGHVSTYWVTEPGGGGGTNPPPPFDEPIWW